MAAKIAILGAGPGGYVAAIRAAALGADVSLVEAGQVGGTCLNRGCIPSKVLKTTADLLSRVRRAREFGITLAGDPGVDMPGLMARKEKVIQTQARGISNLLAHHKVDYIRGTGRIAAPHTLAIQPAEGDEREIVWDKLIVATGAEPFEIPSIPYDGQRILSSTQVLDLEAVPASLVIVGGGVVGCEFAFIFSALGADVTVVEGLSRLLPLPSIDEACSATLAREMKKRKIKVVLNRTVTSVARREDHLKLSLGPSPFSSEPEEKDRPHQPVDAEKMLICVGRTPNTNGIGLGKVGVERDAGGWIVVDERMQTTGDDVFAIGDVLGPTKAMLAHVAWSEGLVAAENALGGRRCMDYRAVPGAVFTSPEVANVGLTEEQARAVHHDAVADTVLYRQVGKAHVIGELAGQVKIVSRKTSGKILGVHIVGARATELIAEGTLAVQAGCTVGDLAETIHAHPTLAEVVMETAMKSAGKALHG